MTVPFKRPRPAAQPPVHPCLRRRPRPACPLQRRGRRGGVPAPAQPMRAARRARSLLLSREAGGGYKAGCGARRAAPSRRAGSGTRWPARPGGGGRASERAGSRRLSARGGGHGRPGSELREGLPGGRHRRRRLQDRGRPHREGQAAAAGGDGAGAGAASGPGRAGRTGLGGARGRSGARGSGSAPGHRPRAGLRPGKVPSAHTAESVADCWCRVAPRALVSIYGNPPRVGYSQPDPAPGTALGSPLRPLRSASPSDFQCPLHLFTCTHLLR